MKTKITFGAGIALVAAFVLIIWQCGGSKEKRKIAVSIANIAQMAILQGDSCISLSEMMKMRAADAMLSSTTYQHKTLSLGGCCPCPEEFMFRYHPGDSCQCDEAESSRQYAALMSWKPELSFVSVSNEAEKMPPFKEVLKEGPLVCYQLPKLNPGAYIFRINAAFDTKNSKTYDVKVNVNKSGHLTW